MSSADSVQILTRSELLRRAEDESREMLGVSMTDAFRMLDNGELRGTIAEAKLTCLRMLLETAK